MGPPRVVRWVGRTVALVVVAALVIVGGTAARVWWTARQDERPRSDAILVLGASQANGRPNTILRYRLAHATRLYRAGVAPRIVTVGGARPGDRYSEAEAGARWLVANGVPRARVAIVPEGADTLASLRAVRRLFARRGWHSAVIVTDPWHSFRSRQMAHDLGLRAATSPTRSGPAVQTRDVQLRYIARETFGYLAYRITGASTPAR